MAVQAFTTSPFASLLERRGVSVLTDNPIPREATVQAVIVAGIRFFELRGPSRSGPVTVHWHQRDGVRHLLSDVPVPLAEATAIIARFLDLLHDVPVASSPERGALEAEAVATLRAGVADDIALPLAA